MKTIRVGAFSSENGADTAQTDMDSHADTSVIGKNALVIHDYRRPVMVAGYDE